MSGFIHENMTDISTVSNDELKWLEDVENGDDIGDVEEGCAISSVEGTDNLAYENAPPLMEKKSIQLPPEPQCGVVYPTDDIEHLRMDNACAIFPSDQFDLLNMGPPLPEKSAPPFRDIQSPAPAYDEITKDTNKPPRVQSGGWVRSEGRAKGVLNKFRWQKTTQKAVTKHKKEEKERLLSWKTVIYDYSQNTTFHGMRMIFEKQPFVIRRFIWLFLFAASATLFVSQVGTNGNYYLTWPVTVDVKINYNDSIIFPAITLCNANNFRITKASEHGLYYMMNELYGPNRENLNISEYNVTGLHLNDLYSKTSHNSSDLIVSCFWDESPCSYRDFVPVMTDSGLCYTFNHGRNNTPLRKAYQTGAKGGLRLQLNIEQYEYMRGPNEGAGLKILMHHPNDIPTVSDHGSAIPPGTHGLVALKIIQVNNLPPNYGKCNDSVKLLYFEDYTMAGCYTDCKEDHLVHKCGCRDIYMPANKQGLPQVCSVSQYHGCMKAADESFYQVRRSCDCPIPCQQPLYQPAVSYSTTSNFDIENLLRAKSNDALREKYVYAREKTQRVDEGVVKENTDRIRGFMTVTKTLDKAFKDMAFGLQNALSALDVSYAKLLQKTQFHNDMALKKVKEMLESNFIRAQIMFHERAFHYVTLDLYGLASYLKRAISTSKSKINPLTDPNERWQIYMPNMNMLSERRTLMSRSKSYIKYTNDAYKDGTPILTYEISYKGRYDKSYVSMPLLKSGADDQLYYYNRIVSAINYMNYGAYKLQQVGEKFATTGVYDSSGYSLGDSYYTSGARNFNFGLHWFEKLSVYKALDVIKARIDDFVLLNRTLHDRHVTIKWKIQEIKDIVESSINSDWQTIISITNSSLEYLNNATILKTDLANEITSTAVEKTISILTFVFEDISLKMKDLKSSLKDLKLSYENVWISMLDEIHTQPLYKQLQEDSQKFLNDSKEADFIDIFSRLLNYNNKTLLAEMDKEEVVAMINGDIYGKNRTHVIEKIENEFVHLTNTLEMAVHIGNSQDRFMAYFKNYKDEMKSFLQNNNIDTKFFRENFMTLDVFLQELSYEEITQQQAYDVAKLMGDIGGLMGLFVGGSVITIFELIDLFVHQGFKVILAKPQ